MSRGLNYNNTYDNRHHGWNTTSPQYAHVTSYDLPLVFDNNRVVFEEDQRPVSSYNPEHVVFEEQYYSVPVHKNHRHHQLSTGPARKQVHFVEHQEKVSESFDRFGNHEVHKESVDSEADGFIKLKHKNFESAKSGAFGSFYN